MTVTHQTVTDKLASLGLYSEMYSICGDFDLVIKTWRRCWPLRERKNCRPGEYAFANSTGIQSFPLSETTRSIL